MRLPRSTCREFLLRAAASLTFAAAAASAADLKIIDLTLRQFDGGPAWVPNYQPAAGESFAFDFRIDGIASIEGEFEDTFKLRFHAELLDEAGKPFAKPIDGAASGAITPEDKKKEWKPKLSGEFQLPPLLREQPATLQVTVEDLVAKSKIIAKRTITIEGPEIPSDAALSASNFRFLRSDADGEALAVAAYNQGDTVWGRFEIVGFAATPEGAVDLSYGLSVANSAGKVMYTQDVAAEEKKRFDYPPSYVPGIVSLQLQRNTPPGDYTIRLTVTDGNATKAVSSDHIFRIEK